MVAPYIAPQTFARPHGRMMTRQAPKPGRPKSKGETLEDRAIGFTPTVSGILETRAESENISVPELVRRAVNEMLNPQPVKVADGFNTVQLPVFYDAPCGPWDAVTEGAEGFAVNNATADWLEIKDGDAFFQVTGESMLSAGIPHGSLVTIRPYGNKMPSVDHIVFVQYLDVDDTWKATVKRFKGWNGNIPRLANGNDEPYPIPTEAKMVDVVGRAISQMGVL
jgi:SOS-response transcriptional repressor LexA